MEEIAKKPARIMWRMEAEVIGSSNVTGTVQNSNWEDAVVSERLISLETSLSDHIAIRVFQSLDLDNVGRRA
jgi:hypothetical protein